MGCYWLLKDIVSDLDVEIESGDHTQESIVDLADKGLKAEGYTPEEITKSKTIVADEDGDISMVMRINLPDEDEDVMPPEDKERLSAEQKKLIGWWVAEGASFDKKISELKVPDDINAILACGPSWLC